MAESIEAVSSGNSPTLGVMKCARCKGTLSQSGQESYRLICDGCGQNYFAVMQLMPTEPKERKLIEDVGGSEGPE